MVQCQGAVVAVSQPAEGVGVVEPGCLGGCLPLACCASALACLDGMSRDLPERALPALVRCFEWPCLCASGACGGCGASLMCFYLVSCTDAVALSYLAEREGGTVGLQAAVLTLLLPRASAPMGLFLVFQFTCSLRLHCPAGHMPVRTGLAHPGSDLRVSVRSLCRHRPHVCLADCTYEGPFGRPGLVVTIVWSTLPLPNALSS